MAGMLMAADATLRAPGGFARLRSRATEVDGQGDVSARAVVSLEGVEPQIEAVDATCAVSESLGNDIALLLFAPLPGVVVTVVERGFRG